MDRPLIVWAKVLLRLALVLLAIGLLPALLLFSVAPMGAIALAIAAR